MLFVPDLVNFPPVLVLAVIGYLRKKKKTLFLLCFLQTNKIKILFVPKRKRMIAFKQANSIGSSFNCLKRYKISFNER